MCLKILRNEPMRTAEEDIIVFKHIISLRSIPHTFFTSFQRAVIQLGIVYTSQLMISEWNDQAVHVGLHSYKHLEDARQANKYWNEQLVECIIPKGSNYYEGTFEDKGPSYASDHLKYVSLIR